MAGRPAFYLAKECTLNDMRDLLRFDASFCPKFCLILPSTAIFKGRAPGDAFLKEGSNLCNIYDMLTSSNS